MSYETYRLKDKRSKFNFERLSFSRYNLYGSEGGETHRLKKRIGGLLRAAAVFIVPISALILFSYVGFYRVMSVSGRAAMDAVAGPGVLELEEGILDVLASLRGAASAGLAVAGYDRYVGWTDFIEGDLVVEAPEGTLVTAAHSNKLDAAVVDGGEWSTFPRADFTWGELVALRRWDVRKVGMVGFARPQCAEDVRRRFLERSRCRFQIPTDVRCDRTFLEK